MSARDEVLARLRASRDAGAPASAPGPVARGYRRSGERSCGSPEVTGLLTERIEDYQATVHRVTGAGSIPAVLATLLTGARVVVPPGLDAAWLAELAPTGAAVVTDLSPAALSAADLDDLDAVVTTCAVAIAETGTFVLDAADPAQGRRALTLVPDHHVCVVLAADVVETVPQALARLDPAHPLTFVSGPSATSDIELDRVEGVHGPRRLDVVLVG